MSESKLTWEDFKRMADLLRDNYVPGPYFIKVHSDFDQAVADAWMWHTRRRERYLERYRRRGRRMKKKR